ncbi:hypothetical protein F5Y16DRAFT_226305 [Xylariaceae sp. FL0255]|nr:hypothetical protein F5Y16DRAFT_226305 [Xylariaceae sp. FL0255]
MGAICSTDRGADSEDPEKDPADSASYQDRGITHYLQHLLDKMIGRDPPTSATTRTPGAAKGSEFKFAFQDDVQDQVPRRTNNALRTQVKPSNDGKDEVESLKGLEAKAKEPKSLEKEAEEKVFHLRKADEKLFKKIPSTARFTSISQTIDQRQPELFKLAKLMPKGAHLHLHFNSTLPPDVLLKYAEGMSNMFLWSDSKLQSADDFRDCHIEFSLRSIDTVFEALKKNMPDNPNLQGNGSFDEKIHFIDQNGPSLFSENYKFLDTTKARNEQEVDEMRYQHFRTRWEEKRALGELNVEEKTCDEWLISKLLFSKTEVDSFYTNETGDSAPFGMVNEKNWRESWGKLGYGEDLRKAKATDPIRKSAGKAWSAFNYRTRMMKGLFNYEKAYRGYTRKCLEEFVSDNVQYAEIRPNFMPSNQIFENDGVKTMTNYDTMEIIIEEYENFMEDIGDMVRIKKDGEKDGEKDDEKDSVLVINPDPNHRPSLSGLKVIYCTPRSFNNDQVQIGLDECLQMKKDYPDYIAGFDLVGEEAFDNKHPLVYFKSQFEKFQKECKKANVEIPFLFHCGETPDDLEGNLEVARDLNSRRIGHGYALPEKPEVLEAMKAAEVCVETCPISNMILGLAEDMKHHSMYELLDKGMHCAVSSDNGTLFKSTLSHDFYEVMVGQEGINLMGWKQLALWSMNHSCFDKGKEGDRERMKDEWYKRWEEFLQEIVPSDERGSQPRPQRLEQLDKARRNGEKKVTERGKKAAERRVTKERASSGSPSSRPER